MHKKDRLVTNVTIVVASNKALPAAPRPSLLNNSALKTFVGIFPDVLHGTSSKHLTPVQICSPDEPHDLLPLPFFEWVLASSQHWFWPR